VPPKKKPKRKRLPPIKRLRNKLDATFNEYIRVRDGRCIFTGTTENLQCSHYYDKGASPNLRWDERNAHAMNQTVHYKHHHGKGADYALWMFSNNSMEFMKQLAIDSMIPVNYKREDYVRMIGYYTEKLERLPR
jgi:hypothetical protein